MINILSLDPSTLSVWYEPRWLRNHPNAEYIMPSIEAALLGHPLPDVPPGDMLIDTAYFTSSVWHENRHYIDLLLTNYGSSRLWQFFSIYLNSAALMDRIHRSGGRIGFPLDIYQDTFRLALLGLAPDADIERLAADITKRAAYFNFDETSLPGGVAVGGQAQFEALAYYFQGQAISHTYGSDCMDNIHHKVNRSKESKFRYLWPAFLANHLKLPAKLKNSAQQIVEFDFVALPSILLATLASRTKWHDAYTSLPSGRLLSFLQYSEKHPDALVCQNWAQAWQRVNEICVELFGCTVSEELSADHKSRVKHFEKHQQGGTFDDVINCMKQILDIRERLLQLLDQNPEVLLDPEASTLGTLRHTHPLPIVYEPGGVDEPPPGFRQIFGFSEGTNRWTWGLVPSPDVWPPSDAVLAMPQLNPWAHMIDTFAPLAKLALRGLRHRTAVGPELNLVLSTLKYGCGVDPIIETPFDEPPDAVLSVPALAQAIGHPGLVLNSCEICKRNGEFVDGKMITAWNRVARAARYGFFDGSSIRVHPDLVFAIQRDWSPIFACNECYDSMVIAGYVG
jgi:hypothetical protein